jgi:RND family efflux transporter MFP subunit
MSVRAAIWSFGCVILVAGCGGGESETPAPAPAAKVDHPVKETDLNAITLAPDTEKRLGITVELVARKSVAKTRVLAGEVIVPPGLTLDVTAPIAGTLAAADAGAPQAGRSVRRGEVLFRIMPLLAADRDQRIDAERERATTRAALEAARRKAARAEQLLEDGSGSRRSAEEARAELAGAEAAASAGEDRMAAVNRGTINAASELVVSAPIDGVVASVQAAPGQTVAASATLLQIARLDRLWVRVPVYSGDAPALDLNHPAAVLRLGDPSGTPGLAARRVSAPPSADAAASAVDVMFELPSGSALQPGERVHVRLSDRATESGIVVSESAILHDINGGTWVYERTAPQVFTRRRVEIRDTTGGVALLARGPQEGAAVVSVGAAELYGIEFGVGK